MSALSLCFAWCFASGLAFMSPPAEPPSSDTEALPTTPTSDATAEPEQPISPLVPRSQIEFLSGHPVDLERVMFRPGKGLTLSSKSGKFELTLGLRVQLRYDLNHDQDRDDDGDGEVEPAVEHSFQIRRARVVFTGHMFGKHNKFKTELSISPRDVGLGGGGTRFTIVRDFYLEFDHLRDLTVRVGQYKLPYSQQRVISSGRQQFVDRSIVGSEFDLDRDIGLDFRSADFLGVNRMRYYAGVFVGGGRDNFALEPVTTGGGLLYLARFEVLPLGLFDDYVEGDFTRTKKPRLSLGGGYSYMDDAVFTRGNKGSAPTDEGTTDYHNATASLMFKIVGLSISGEFFWRRGVRRPGQAVVEDALGGLSPAPIEAPRNGLGWYGQAGYMIPRAPVEIVGRFSRIDAIGSVGETSILDRREVGGGINWYVAGHPFKLQADYFRVWGGGVAEGVDQFRVQAQISF